MKTCFLFGNRYVPPIADKLNAALELCYAEGIRRFVVGHRGAFDACAVSALAAFRKTHEDICVQLLLAYHPALRPHPAPEGFDGTFYPDGLETVPMPFAIVRANEQMVKGADRIICYVSHPGNSEKLLKRAKRKQIPVINLANGLR